MGYLIVHVAQVEITRATGMGRVAWHWRRAFEQRGHRFVHIGPSSLRRPVHPALFPYAAYRAYRRSGITADAILVHEPAGAPFVFSKRLTVVFSHGIERRGWAVALRLRHLPGGSIKWRSRVLYPLWRLAQCDIALRNAPAALMLNTDDLAFARLYYDRSDADTWLFRNGVDPLDTDKEVPPGDPRTILFLGQWSVRKGVTTLVEAADLLQRQGIFARWLVAGVGCDPQMVLDSWPDHLKPHLEVVPSFAPEDETALHARASIFVLPSFFEGQPLALLQAMAMARCCIASNTCGQKDLIEHGHNGLLHEPGDAMGLAAHLRTCLIDPSTRATLGRHARASVTERTWHMVATETVKHVERLIEERRLRGRSERCARAGGS